MIPGFLIFLGMTLKVWAAMVDMSPPNAFRPEGPYRFVRHPELFAQLLTCLGLLLTIKNIFIILATFLCIALYLYFEIRRKDIAKESHWGQEYQRYLYLVGAIYPQLWPWPLEKNPPASTAKKSIVQGITKARFFVLLHTAAIIIIVMRNI